MNHDPQFSQYKTAVEKHLQSLCRPAGILPQSRLFDAMQYSLLAGGKRLRPILTCEFARISGGSWEKALPFACAVEMIHTYSLIHDDLPCMDNDDLRRGKPTNHIVFGEAMAVLAGDALLTDAFRIAASCNLNSPDLNVKAIASLSEAAGSLGMVGGQVLDMLSEERICTEEEVLDIQSRKTGCLIRTACELGVIAAGADPRKMSAAAQFADALGLAFQIRDDMLDVIGDAAQLGKSTGTDELKNTFVRLYGLEKCEKMVQSYTDRAIAALSEFGEAADLLAEFSYTLVGRKA